VNPEAALKVAQISLSRHTVKRRIASISDWIEAKVLGQLQLSPVFSIQLKAEIIVYVRFVLGKILKFRRIFLKTYLLLDQKIEEQLLFCKPLETTTTGIDIFQLLDAYFKKNLIDWHKCDSICSDGAPALN
jgi:hypothetical protein